MGSLFGGGGGSPQVIYQQPAAAVAAPAAASVSDQPSPTPVGGEDALKAKRQKTGSLLYNTDQTLLGS